MDDGIDQGLAQGAFVDQPVLLSLRRAGNPGAGSVFNVQLVEHAVGGLDQRAEAVFFSLDQIAFVGSGIFGDLDGNTVGIRQEVGGIVEVLIRRIEIEVVQEGRVDLKPLFLIIDFQLLEREFERGRRGNVAQRVAHPPGIELVNHARGHGLHAAANPSETTCR